MRYLLCEDSTGGLAFWENVNRLLLGGYFDVVDHSAGRGGLKKKIESLLPLEQSDVVLVAIDDIPKSHAIIQSIGQLQKEHSIDLCFTNYWCIEEVLVSFADLAKGSFRSQSTNRVTIQIQVAGLMIVVICGLIAVAKACVAFH